MPLSNSKSVHLRQITSFAKSFWQLQLFFANRVPDTPSLHAPKIFGSLFVEQRNAMRLLGQTYQKCLLCIIFYYFDWQFELLHCSRTIFQVLNAYRRFWIYFEVPFELVFRTHTTIKTAQYSAIGVSFRHSKNLDASNFVSIIQNFQFLNVVFFWVTLTFWMQYFYNRASHIIILC